MTTLKHPDGPNLIEVEPSSVALYAASGWVVVKTPEPKSPKK